MEQLSGKLKTVNDVKFWDIITLYNGSWYLVLVCVLKKLNVKIDQSVENKIIDASSVTHIQTYHYSA